MHDVTYRYSELNETNSIYDYLVAAGPDSDRMVQWSVWVVLTSGVAIFVATVLISILCSKRSRKSAFNLYLVFLMIPDFLFSFLCAINCGLNVSVGSYISEAWCWFQSCYVIFSIGANSWLNAIVAYHIYELLQKSSQRLRYKPPSRRQVIINSGLVYAWSAFLSSWIFWDILPHQPGVQNGLACLPVMYSSESMIFFFAVFLPVLVGFPAIYVIYVAIQIRRLRLLPASGSTRNVSVFIARLILVFIVMWVPSLILMFIASFWIPPWGAWAGGTWSHLQGAVSAAVCLMKPDIGEGYLLFMTCGRYPKRTESNSGSTDTKVSGWMVSPSVLQLNPPPRRLSHETDFDQTEKNHDELECTMEFSLDDAHNSDCEKGFYCSSNGGFGFVLDVLEEEEEEEVKDNSGDMHKSSDDGD